jgi:hypothetical protein
MDPARHMYSFENNRYTPLTVSALLAMMEEGAKPALNQDGIHNLMSLYECYVDEPTIYELREDGFYTCRATVKLLSFRTGQPMGAGTGSCSTRESKYAYRWVSKSRLPKGTDAASLRQQERQGKSGAYVVYRLDNEDLADVEATVLQMAVKRAKSAAVKALPLVSEMFAGVGDPDEEARDDDAERQELLAPLGVWLKGLRVAARGKAILAVFGEPLSPEDIKKLDEDRLIKATQVLDIATKERIDWSSPTLGGDLKTALSRSAAQAKAALFDNAASSSATERETFVDVVTGEVTEPSQDTPKNRREGGKVATSPQGEMDEKSPQADWRSTLEKYVIDTDVLVGVLPAELRTACLDACADSKFPAAKGEDLAAQVVEWVHARQEADET